MTTNLNKVKAEQEMASTKKSSIDLDNDDFLSGSSSVKTEIASLSSQVISLVLSSTTSPMFDLTQPIFFERMLDIMFSKVFTLKTTVFELSTDLTGVKRNFCFGLHFCFHIGFL